MTAPRPSQPSVDEIRAFWQKNPVDDSDTRSRETLYDFFRDLDNNRESYDVEPYAFSNFIHDYENSDGKRVLDYGCGNGYALAHYARHGADVYGVDLTEAAIERSRARFRLLELEGTFVLNDGRSIPFDDAYFDVACSMGVLHHIPDPAPVVAELYRVLKPGGKLIVMLYHRDSFRYRVTFRLQRRFGPSPFRGKTQQELVNMNDGGGNPWGAVYSKKEARQLLSQFEHHRFHVGKLGLGELVLWRPRLERVLLRIVPRQAMRGLAGRYGWNLYCIARKPL